ncbi:MAG: hypothetical protein ACUVQ5_04645 [Candidatus Methanomethylicaceae archaeon]
MTVSQVIVTIILLQSAVLINVSAERYTLEVEVMEKTRDLETISYNILFDFCLNLKRWVTEINGTVNENEIEGRLASWVMDVREALREDAIVEITIGNLQIERYEGQACDALQMAFIGRENLSGWYIIGFIQVDAEWLFVKIREEFKINIAV